MSAQVVPHVRGVDVPTLYAVHWRAMVRLAVLLVDDVPTAEDVVQEAFLSLHRRQSGLRDQDASLAYVRAAVVNGCRSALRRRSVARRKLDELARRPAPHEDEAARIEGDEAMIAALRRLPRRMREVLVLRYWLDLSESQTAQVLGISAGAVKSSASRGLAKLRHDLGGAS